MRNSQKLIRNHNILTPPSNEKSHLNDGLNPHGKEAPALRRTTGTFSMINRINVERSEFRFMNKASEPKKNDWQTYL